MAKTQMFIDDTFQERDTCGRCRWQQTSMCPKSLRFVGRHMRDPEEYQHNHCHRFYPTQGEIEYRHNLIMNKLHENLGVVETEDYPF